MNHRRRRAAAALAVAIAALSTSACRDRSPTDPGEAASSARIPTADSVAVSTTVSSPRVSPHDTFSVTISVTNLGSRSLELTVAERIVDPAGGSARTATWKRQNLPSGKSFTVKDGFTISPDAIEGDHTVAVSVTTPDGGVALYAAAAAARFSVVRPAPAPPPAPAPRFVVSRLADPARTIVEDAGGRWLATFTDGASTVALAGPSRSFAEPENTSAVVTHDVWVRVLAEPFDGQVEETLLDSLLADRAPDVLGIAMQYIVGAPEIYDDDGLKIAGDADYGPLQDDGKRKEGADFNDYLGISWTYDDGTVREPRAEFLNSIDCSGLVRMVFGYRSGMPLVFGSEAVGIHRRASEILAAGPGVVTIENTGEQVTDFSPLQIGDLVFFDAASDDGDRIDHVGIYLGVDGEGHHRFISSRKSSNGPTLGDLHGRSILETVDGSGYFALGFRAARRP